MAFATIVMMALGTAGVVTGDFDGDRRVDRASVERRGDGSHALIVRRGNGGAPVVVTRVDDPATFYVERGKRGTYATACAKGLGRDRAPCPRREVKVTRDTLAFGAAESSQALAVWTGRGFKTAWLSD